MTEEERRGYDTPLRSSFISMLTKSLQNDKLHRRKLKLNKQRRIARIGIALCQAPDWQWVHHRYFNPSGRENLHADTRDTHPSSESAPCDDSNRGCGVLEAAVDCPAATLQRGIVSLS
jgi:hypothetical protein